MYNSKELPLYKSITQEERHIANTISKYIQPSSNILDIGCGTGEISRIIKNNVHNLKIDAVELDVTQLKNNYVFKNIFNEDYADWNFSDKYDCVIFSHVLGHFDYDLRYNKAFQKVFDHNSEAEILIVTNSVSGTFEIIQNEVWSIFNDRSYYIDIEKVINDYTYTIEAFSVELKHPNKFVMYKLLETFSPYPLPPKIPISLETEIEKLYHNSFYSLNIPQFFIKLRLSNNGEFREPHPLENHNLIWERLA